MKREKDERKKIEDLKKSKNWKRSVRKDTAKINVGDLSDIYNLAAWHIFDRLDAVEFAEPADIRRWLGEVFGSALNHDNIKSYLMSQYTELHHKQNIDTK